MVIKTLSIDPGKNNTWFSLWRGRKLGKTGHFPTPNTPHGYITEDLYKRIARLFDDLEMSEGDELVMERYQARRGKGGGSVSECVNLLIGMFASEARRRGINVVIIQAADHKNAYNKHHSEKFPRGLIKKAGDRHATWRPRLKRYDPCDHVMDSMTLGVYRILKREGIL